MFPPLSAQIKHETFVYQDMFDETRTQKDKQSEFNEQYKSTTIRQIRENPEEYIDQTVSINGQLKSTIFSDMYYRSDTGIGELFDTVIIDKNDYRIYLDRNYYFSSKINNKGEPVKPVFNAWDEPCMVTIKGEIKYIYAEHAVQHVTTELLVIIPHEIIYDGLTWSIPTSTPTIIPTQQGGTIVV